MDTKVKKKNQLPTAAGIGLNVQFGQNISNKPTGGLARKQAIAMRAPSEGTGTRSDRIVDSTRRLVEKIVARFEVFGGIYQTTRGEHRHKLEGGQNNGGECNGFDV